MRHQTTSPRHPRGRRYHRPNLTHDRAEVKDEVALRSSCRRSGLSRWSRKMRAWAARDCRRWRWPRRAAGAAAVWAKRRALAATSATARDLHGARLRRLARLPALPRRPLRELARTFHRTMTTEATPANVRGDFSGATLRHAGVEARMDRDAAGGYRMTFTTPGRAAAHGEVVRAVGSRRYQQYLAARGRHAAGGCRSRTTSRRSAGSR